jgi:hypothetical protein
MSQGLLRHVLRPLACQQGRQVHLRLALCLLAAFLVFHHISEVAEFALASQPASLRAADFGHYYMYARNLIEGRDLIDLEAPRLLAGQLGIRYADNPPNYPPPLYLGMSLLAFLPYHLASIVWLLMNELFLLVALFWRGMGRVIRNPVRMAMLSVVVFAFQPLYETLALGQINLLLLAGITLLGRLWGMGSVWSGVVLGLVVLVKPQFAALGLLWLRPREWHHLGAAVGTVGTVSFASLAVVGRDAWSHYFNYLSDFPCEISLWLLNISLRGLFFHLNGSCLADGFGDPMAVVSAVVGAVILGALAFYWWRYPPADPPDRFQAVALGLCAIFLVSPYTQEHHLTVLLIAFAGLAIDSKRPDEGFQRAGWIVAYVLIATAYSLARFPAFHLGLPSVFLFGKGFGVLLLGVLLLLKEGSRRSVAPSLLLPLLAAVGGARAAHAVLKGVLLGEPDVDLLREIMLSVGLLLSWAILFRAGSVKVKVKA